MVLCILVAEGLDGLLMDSNPLGDLRILEDDLQLALVEVSPFTFRLASRALEGLTLHLPLGL
jgi:hypothetical protein